jgi:hypothetical protein
MTTKRQLMHHNTFHSLWRRYRKRTRTRRRYWEYVPQGPAEKEAIQDSKLVDLS